MHKLAVLGLIAVGFSAPSAHATFLHVPKFTVRTLTSDGVPVNGAVTKLEIAGMHGGYRFFCGVPGFVYPCVDWDGYFDYVKQFELTTDATGQALVADHRYPFSSVNWREPEIRLWIEGVLIRSARRPSRCGCARTSRECQARSLPTSPMAAA